MGISRDQVFKDLRLNLPPWLDGDEREEIMEEAAEYLLTETLDYIANGISPVTGKPLAKLTKEYADNEKGGDRTPNMDLYGDMMRAMEVKVEADRIRLGIFDADQAIKAYGHITGFEGHPWLDGKVEKRKLVPDEQEYFAPDIMSGVRDIIDDFVEVIREREDSEEASG